MHMKRLIKIHTFPARTMLLSRIVHRAVFGGQPNTWAAFSDETGEVRDRVHPNVVFRALLLRFHMLRVRKPVILLAVDELIKCGAGPAIELLRMCKTFVSSFTAHCRRLVTIRQPPAR